MRDGMRLQQLYIDGIKNNYLIDNYRIQMKIIHLK